MICLPIDGMLYAWQLGNSRDVTYHATQRYRSVFDQTFIIRYLPPYYRNVVQFRAGRVWWQIYKIDHGRRTA
jgi:hypothetical protein